MPRPVIRALTVRQPWAWALFHGKDVENRTQLWRYRGLLAIHAAQQVDAAAMRLPLVRDARNDALAEGADTKLHRGVILGVVDLVDAHRWQPGCCTSPWAETGLSAVHLVLKNPRELRTPILCQGTLGIWSVGETITDLVHRQLKR